MYQTVRRSAAYRLTWTYAMGKARNRDAPLAMASVDRENPGFSRSGFAQSDSPGSFRNQSIPIAANAPKGMASWARNRPGGLPPKTGSFCTMSIQVPWPTVSSTAKPITPRNKALIPRGIRRRSAAASPSAASSSAMAPTYDA
ncbi:hypothetical protein DDD63_03305 [Actinobaculum sp. 313]|nr:hypothetical protein DDD63_03305 [Actinobaculum sp. 313]